MSPSVDIHFDCTASTYVDSHLSAVLYVRRESATDLAATGRSFLDTSSTGTSARTRRRYPLGPDPDIGHVPPVPLHGPRGRQGGLGLEHRPVRPDDAGEHVPVRRVPV